MSITSRVQLFPDPVAERADQGVFTDLISLFQKANQVSAGHEMEVPTAFNRHVLCIGLQLMDHQALAIKSPHFRQVAEVSSAQKIAIGTMCCCPVTERSTFFLDEKNGDRIALVADGEQN